MANLIEKLSFKQAFVNEDFKNWFSARFRLQSINNLGKVREGALNTEIPISFWNTAIEDVINSINEAFKDIQEHGFENVSKEIKRISIGTTHFINAVIKRSGLEKVACIRLCGVSSQSLPPFSDFPNDLKNKINGGCYLVNGGFEFDGKVITEINEAEIIDIIKKIQQDGVKHVAVWHHLVESSW